MGSHHIPYVSGNAFFLLITEIYLTELDGIRVQHMGTTWFCAFNISFLKDAQHLPVMKSFCLSWLLSRGFCKQVPKQAKACPLEAQGLLSTSLVPLSPRGLQPPHPSPVPSCTQTPGQWVPSHLLCQAVVSHALQEPPRLCPLPCCISSRQLVSSSPPPRVRECETSPSCWWNISAAFWPWLCGLQETPTRIPRITALLVICKTHSNWWFFLCPRKAVLKIRI